MDHVQRLDGRWLYIDEAAQLLGMKDSTLRQRMYDRKWPRQKGPNGRLQVMIPSDIIEATQALATNPAEPSPGPDDTGQIQALALAGKPESLAVVPQIIERILMQMDKQAEIIRQQDAIIGRLRNQNEQARLQIRALQRTVLDLLHEREAQEGGRCSATDTQAE